MKFTEGAFRNWGYALAEREFGDSLHLGAVGAHQGRQGREGRERRAEGRARRGKILIKDAIADITPAAGADAAGRVRRDRHAATSTATTSPTRSPRRSAASASRRAATSTTSPATRVFEATHGTAPKYADQDKVNPGSVILSGEMMLRYMGWTEAADLIIKGMDKAHRPEDGDLRLRAPDGGREGSEVLGVRHGHHQEHGAGGR